MQEALSALDRLEIAGASVPVLRQMMSLAGRLKTRADAVLCGCSAEISASDAKLSATGVLQEQANVSLRDAKRMAGVGEALAELPTVAQGLAAGKISLDNAAALAGTARDAGTEAVEGNPVLLRNAEKLSPERLARDARRVADEASRDRGESRLKRQRHNRKASTGVDRDTGMGWLHGQFDPISQARIQQALDGKVDNLWRADHEAGKADQRSNAQRRADAIFETITGLDALTGEPLPQQHGGNGKAGRAKSVRDQLIIVAEIGLLDGQNPDGRCEIPGTGPVPPSILAGLSPDADLAGIIFDRKGRPLWLGRNQRAANIAQYLAVAARDGGCVKCGAPMHQSDIHHIVEWEHGGTSDIDNLCALCRTHHRQHHGHEKKNQERPRRGKQAKPTGGRAEQTKLGGLAMRTSDCSSHKLVMPALGSRSEQTRQPGPGLGNPGDSWDGRSPSLEQVRPGKRPKPAQASLRATPPSPDTAADRGPSRNRGTPRDRGPFRNRGASRDRSGSRDDDPH